MIATKLLRLRVVILSPPRDTVQQTQLSSPPMSCGPSGGSDYDAPPQPRKRCSVTTIETRFKFANCTAKVRVGPAPRPGNLYHDPQAVAVAGL